MKYILKKFRLPAILAITVSLSFMGCNKDVPEIKGSDVAPVTGVPLGETLAAIPDDSLYMVLVKRAGLLPTINNPSASYTMFVPDNNAMRLLVNRFSGGAIPVSAPDAIHAAVLGGVGIDTAAGIVSYNIIPQVVRAAQLPASFPNLQYPTIINPAPSISALLRLTTFPSAANGAWVNDIPLTNLDIPASNGVIHNTAFVPMPPAQKFLWNRIDTDPELTYLKAAILRADSASVTATTPGTLQAALLNIGASLTVLAPTDLAFQTAITGAVAQALIAQGVPPATALAQATALASSPTVFSNPALFPVLTAQTVQGIVVYHLLGKRAFTNNFPTDVTLVPTLLNGAIANHPGVGLQATFGTPFVTVATVKGLYNSTPANVIINASPLLPDPIGSSDQHYLNGTIQKIDQVLLPLPL